MSENKRFEQCVLFRDSAQLKEGNSSLHTWTCPLQLDDDTWPYLRLLGSVCGLLCLSDGPYIRTSTRILIWNPILQKYIKLPMTTFRDRISVVGFGYDCRKSDHRVVRIYCHSTEAPLVEVFSVQHQTQRIISADYLVKNSITNVHFAHCFLNGVIHWLTWDAARRPFRPKSLLLFNVSDEKFDMMELPEAITNMQIVNDNFGVFEYQGKLSVSHCVQIPGWTSDISARCQIWVKQEYNDASSWCKIVDVTPIPLPGISHNGPVQYLGKNGELLGYAKNRSNELVYSIQFSRNNLWLYAVTPSHLYGRVVL